MGCICSRVQDVDQHIDIRARYSVDSPRHQDELFASAFVNAVPSSTGHSLPHVASASQHRPSTCSRPQQSHSKQIEAVGQLTGQHQLQLLPPSILAQQQLHSRQNEHAAVAALLHNRATQITDNPSSGLSASFGNSKCSPPNALSPLEVLALCSAVVGDNPALEAASISPLLLASLCLIESGGQPDARHYREEIDEAALGICQVLLSTARWLASSKGFDRYGASPTAEDMDNSKCCLYYCSAYLSMLSLHNGTRRSEQFIVKAYHAGPKAVNTPAADMYWQKFLKAKYWLKEVAKAVAFTVAAAATAAGLQLSVTVTAFASHTDSSSHIVCQHKSNQVVLPDSNVACDAVNSSSDPSRELQVHKSSMISSSDKHDSHGGCKGADSQCVWLWKAAARMIPPLASSWETPFLGDAAGAGNTTGANSTAVSAASFITQLILPRSWSSGSSTDRSHKAQLQQLPMQPQSQQQQGSQHAAQDRTGWASSTHSRWGRPSRSSTSRLATIQTNFSGGNSGNNGSINPSTAAGAFALQAVPSADVQAALARLHIMEPTVWHAAVISAAAHKAATAAAVATKALDTHHVHQQQAPGTSNAAGTAAAGSSKQPIIADNFDSLPCLMHVVGTGESLSQIAKVCGVATSDVMAANPDLPAGSAVQPNDCIALPVLALLPQLYVLQPGDTIYSIAKAHMVPVGRLLAKNPELSEPARVQPGWVVALPGLKGDSKAGAPMESLATAAAAAEAAVHDTRQRDMASAGSAVLEDVAQHQHWLAPTAAMPLLPSWQLQARQQHMPQHTLHPDQQVVLEQQQQFLLQQQQGISERDVPSQHWQNSTAGIGVTVGVATGRASGLIRSISEPSSRQTAHVANLSAAAAAAAAAAKTLAKSASARHATPGALPERLLSVGSGAFMFAVGDR